MLFRNTSPSLKTVWGFLFLKKCPRQESNLHPELRRPVFYPLDYEGKNLLAEYNLYINHIRRIAAISNFWLYVGKSLF